MFIYLQIVHAMRARIRLCYIQNIDACEVLVFNVQRANAAFRGLCLYVFEELGPRSVSHSSAVAQLAMPIRGAIGRAGWPKWVRRGRRTRC